MARSGDSSDFLSQAEKLARECAAKNPNLSVWRGTHPYVSLGSSYDCDTIIVGISDDETKPPAIPVLKVWNFVGSHHLKFEPDPNSPDCMSMTGPAESVLADFKKDVIPKLERLFQ